MIFGESSDEWYARVSHPMTLKTQRSNPRWSDGYDPRKLITKMSLILFKYNENLVWNESL